MKFYAYHGCFKEEAIVGMHFSVDLVMYTDTSKPQKSDNLEDTVDYQSVYLMVKEQMETRSNLLEHVLQRILTELHKKFPEVKHAEATLHKLNPPLGSSVVNSVSVTLNSDDLK